MLMIPELLQVQRYVLTYRFSQDHLELLFNSIRVSGRVGVLLITVNSENIPNEYLCLVSNVCIVFLFSIQGGWNNNPSSAVWWFGVVSHLVRQAMWQHKITLCPCLLWSCPLLKLLKSTICIRQHFGCDHSYLPTQFGGLVENALVYREGFVVRQILRKLSCDVCRASLVRDARPASFDKSYHLLALKNNGGLVIPSQGTVKV